MSHKVATAVQRNYEFYPLRKVIGGLLEQIGLDQVVAGKKVLVKPNCTGIHKPEAAMTVHPAVVVGVVDCLQKYGALVTIGESSSVHVDTRVAFEITGMIPIARTRGIPLVDFKQEPYERIRVKGDALHAIYVPRRILTSDYVFSLAKLKTNYVSTISCSVKNLKGLLPDQQKKEFHTRGLAGSIFDLYHGLQHVVPSVGLVDGIIGSELGEPRAAHILLASTDLMALDNACCQAMGIDPHKVPYLVPCDSLHVHPRVTPPDTPFQTASGLHDLAAKYPIEIIDGKPCSSCSGSLQYGLKRVSETRPELLEGVVVQLGRGCLPDHREKVLFGNCAVGFERDFRVVGCPPTRASFMKTLISYRAGDRD